MSSRSEQRALALERCGIVVGILVQQRERGCSNCRRLRETAAMIPNRICHFQKTLERKRAI